MADQTHLLAIVPVGPERFTKAAFIAANDIRRRRQNMRGRAVVLFEPHHMRAGEILFKPQDIADLGPAPAIDRLIIIPHTADILVPPRQQAQPEILCHVGILIFVDKDVAEAAVIFC